MIENNLYEERASKYVIIKDNILSCIDYLNFILTKIGALFKSPKLCSLSWGLAIKRHNFSTKIKKKNILILYRSLGIEDFNYFTVNDKKKLSMFVLPRSQIKAIFEIYFGTRKDHILRDDSYVTNDEKIELTKKKYRIFLEKTLNYLNLKYNFTTIIGFNFQFYAERELHTAAQNKNIKFVCLHKESLIFPGELIAYKKMLKKLGQYTGEKILVYNEYIKKAIVSSKFVNSKKIKSIGMPRADFYYNEKNKNIINKKKKIFLILIINTKRNIFFIKKDRNIQNKLKLKIRDIIWDNLAKKTMENILKFAKKNKNIDFIFKVKNPVENNNQLKEIFLDQLIHDNSLDNCRIISNINTGRLIKYADLVIGFNSTAVIESLIFNRNVIVPMFGIKKNIIKNFTLNLGKTVFYPKDFREFKVLLQKASENKLLKKNKKKIIKKLAKAYVGNHDGNSTSRLLKEI